jgi:hypothetical protein
MTDRGSLNHSERVHRKVETNGERNRVRPTLPCSHHLLIERPQCGILTTTISTAKITARVRQPEAGCASPCRPPAYLTDDRGRKSPPIVPKNPLAMACHCPGSRRRDLPMIIPSGRATTLL